MGKTYFHQYIDDLDKIAKQYRVKHDLASVRVEKARQKNSQVQNDRASSADKRMVSAAALREAEREHKRDMEEIEAGADREIKALRKNFEQHMAEFFTAKPEKIDQAAVSLMASGIMKASDLEALANQHANNPTMLRLISSHAHAMNEGKGTDLIDRRASVLHGIIERFCATKERLDLFDTAAKVVLMSVDRDEYRAGAFQREWDGGVYSNIKAHMTRMESFVFGEG